MQIIRKFKKRKIYSSFRGKGSTVILSKYNRGIKYLLCANDLFSKYVWFVPLKDKRGSSIVNVFEKII